MKAELVRNLQLTEEEVAVITILYDLVAYDLESEDCDMGELVYAIAHGQHQSRDIIITYLDEKAE